MDAERRLGDAIREAEDLRMECRNLRDRLELVRPNRERAEEIGRETLDGIAQVQSSRTPRDTLTRIPRPDVVTGRHEGTGVVTPILQGEDRELPDRPEVDQVAERFSRLELRAVKPVEAEAAPCERKLEPWDASTREALFPTPAPEPEIVFEPIPAKQDRRQARDRFELVDVGGMVEAYRQPAVAELSWLEITNACMPVLRRRVPGDWHDGTTQETEGPLQAAWLGSVALVMDS
jgi:hypothetical protein